MSSIDLGDQVVPIENVQQLRNGDDSRDINRLKRSAAGKRAAAFATGNLVASFLGNGTPQQQQKAAEVLQEISSELSEQEGAAPVAQPQPELILPTPAAETEPEPEVVTDYTLPPDIEALVTDDPEDDEPDFDFTEDEPEPVAEFAEDEDGEYVDPQVAKLRRELERANKKADHERKLRVQSARKGWEQEAARVFALGDVPLLDADDLKTIKADSKREFMRQAKQLADDRKKIALRFQPTGQVRQPQPQPRDWGTPPASGPTVPDEAPARVQEQRLAAARRSGNLANILKAHIFNEE